MAEKLSVKGLTIGTPEFHAIAKRGEEEYEQQAKVDAIVEMIYEIDELSVEQARRILGALGF